MGAAAMKTILATLVLLLALSFLCNALPMEETKVRKIPLGILSPNDIGRGPLGPNGEITGQYTASSPKSKWPNATVYWAYDPANTFTAVEKEIMERGMQEMANWTCIKFVPRTTQKGYVNIQNDLAGCVALINYSGEKQYLNMAKPCFADTSTFQHEMMHSLGFEHEQTRYDRDMYVEVLWDNIEPNPVSRAQFEKNPRTHAYPPYEYDLFSVMQYDLSSFGMKGRPSMALVTPNSTIDEYEVGRATKMLKSDINRIRSAYKCDYQGEGARVPTKTR